MRESSKKRIRMFWASLTNMSVKFRALNVLALPKVITMLVSIWDSSMAPSSFLTLNLPQANRNSLKRLSDYSHKLSN